MWRFLVAVALGCVAYAPSALAKDDLGIIPVPNAVDGQSRITEIPAADCVHSRFMPLVGSFRSQNVPLRRLEPSRDQYRLKLQNARCHDAGP